MGDSDSDYGDRGSDVEGNLELLDPTMDLTKLAKRHRMFSLKVPPAFSESKWEPGWDVNGSVRLGESHTGVARLYLRRSDDGNIVDRVVVKDVFLDYQSWTAFHKWHGPPQDGVPNGGTLHASS